MSVLTLNHKEAHKFVREQRRAGNNVRWSNYDMVFWRPTPRGFKSTTGAFYRGRWGIQTIIKVNDRGLWLVPLEYAKSV